MRRHATWAAVTAAFFAGACADRSPVAPPEPDLAIVDSRNSDQPGFYFGFPVRRFNQEGDIPTVGFNPGLSPRIQFWDCGPATATATACPEDRTTWISIGAPITLTSGTHLVNRIFVLEDVQRYLALWNTKPLNLDPTRIYHLEVDVGGHLLGSADVDVVRRFRELFAVDRDDYVALLEDGILPIPFWIGENALCEEGTSACTSETVEFGPNAPATTVEFQTPEEVIRVDFPAGTTVTTEGGETVDEVTFNLELCEGIDVDLALFGQCIRLTSLVSGGTATSLQLSNAVLISLCSLHLPRENQEALVTLHQQDGDVIRALPHVEPNCPEAEPVPSGRLGDAWRGVRDALARLFAPRPLYARARVALVLNQGGGGESDFFGTSEESHDFSAAARLQLQAPAPGPGVIVTDFQFALPAKMQAPDLSPRSGPVGATLSFVVDVTDARGDFVSGGDRPARVTFTVIGAAQQVVTTQTVDVVEGVAQFNWTAQAGTFTVIASGRGIASPSLNGPLTEDPDGEGPISAFDPFWPDFGVPAIAGRDDILLRTGTVTFTATAGLADLIIESLTHSPQNPTDVDLMEFGVTVRNVGTAATGPFYVIVTTTSPGQPTETTTLGGLAIPGSSVPAGESHTLCCFRSYRVAGEYTQTAQADFHTQDNLNNQVPESNENNNTLVDEYTVSTVTGLFAVTRTEPAASGEIFKLNSDGSGSVNLSNNAAIDAEPTWSPNGTRIAFQSRRADVGDVWVMNADGSNPVNLTNNPEAFEISPSWSGDGTKIAYMNRTPFDQIFVINADGTNNSFVAGTEEADAGFPSFSPDGSKIAFATQRDGNTEIYVMNADGSNPVNLTQHAGFDLSPVWSPDGTKIAWFTTRDGNGEIYVMNADGSNPTNVTRNAANDRLGEWSPDSRYLVFSSARDGNEEVYITTLDGFFVKRITNNAVEDLSPSWRRQ